MPQYLKEIERSHAAFEQSCMQQNLVAPLSPDMRVGDVVAGRSSGKRGLICEEVIQLPVTGNLDGCVFPAREVGSGRTALCRTWKAWKILKCQEITTIP